ncbi:proteasome stabiliser-domain-containing protein [Geopyxis carbonaria]|nr:proteasome stabiliser-domain-containing protein [Geopyxis carbonaria]
MAEVPDQAKELRLVENVELKIALADTDGKLQRLLNLYLPPIILKLNSPHITVRNKVIAVCQHISTRIKPTTFTLPVVALLTQFKDPTAGGTNQLIRSFDLMYIKVGLGRIPVSERLELLPALVGDISKFNNEHHQRSLLNIILQLLPHFTPPPRGSTEDTALREKLGFTRAPEDAVWLAGWFRKLMLLRLDILQPNAPQPGLTPADVDFLTLDRKKETFSPFSVLAEIKVAVLKFISSGAFTEEERYFVTLIASTDTNSAVADPADDTFKRCASSVSLEDDKIVKELFELLLGKPGVPAVKPTLQAKIVGLISKSKQAVSGTRKVEINKIIELGLDSNSYPKLKQAVFSFITWTARLADDSLTHELAPGAVEKLRYWILSNPDAPAELKGYSYENMALLASRCLPIVLEPHLDIIRFFFQRLDDDKGGVATSIEGALSILLAKIAKEQLDPIVRSALEELLIGTISRETRAVGQAVKWAGRLLGFGNVVGRWIGALAVAMGGTVAEEGGKALHPYYYRLINPEAALPTIEDAKTAMDIDQDDTAEKKYAFPEFAPLVQYLFAASHSLPDSLRTQALVDGRLPAKTFAAALAFSKRIAIWHALQPHLEIKNDEDWERTVDTAVITDETARNYVEKFLETFITDVEILLDQAWHGMVFEREGVEGVTDVWNSLAVLIPDAFVARYVPQLDIVKLQLTAPKAKSRLAAAQAVGLLGSHCDVESSILKNLVEALVEDVEKNKIGAVSALGFLISRLQFRSRLAAIDEELVKCSVKAIVAILIESRDAALVETAIEAFGELAVSTAFSADMVDAGKIRTILGEKAKRGNEKAVLALGYLTFIYPSDSEETKDILTELIKLGEDGGVERSFIVGEALTNVAAGWGSSSVRRGRKLAGVSWTGTRRTGTKDLLSQLLARAGEPGGGGKRRVTVVALLSIFELCADDDVVKDRLQDAQKAFRSFLTDRDEFIQETAARGLTAVYNMSDEATRKDLVRSLVSSFTGEVREKMQVNRDTQLFEPGQLPTGDGSSVGSYGDIMSLAAELGDPSLVYKFMTLARHNSVWASRAAFGRFGIGSMLSSSDEVRNNDKLWPVLFRYRFDPSAGVRQSMDSIWSALGGGVETIERWRDQILSECLKGAINGKEWRVREASICALADLLGGRKVSQYKQHLEGIWNIAFKVLDDVKESVRKAAMKLCRVLTAGMVRAIEGDGGPKEKQEILGILMDFLIGSQGLEAGAKEVQMFALNTLLQIIKCGGETLRPWIPEMVEKMLLILSDLEPEAVNYLVMNADKYNTTGDDIDRIRLNSIRSSPIMSSIEDLLDNLDASSTARLVPQLLKSIRTSLGLPSKIACSRVIVSMVMRRPTLFKKYADEVLKPLLGAVKDRSEVVSHSYAVSIGYLCRIASDKGILEVLKWTQTCYWEGEERERRAAGAVVAAVFKHATDRANNLAIDLLPFVFIGKSDIDESVAEEFSHTWTENTGGTGAIKLYLKEIVGLAMVHIASPRWSAKQTCAFALADAAKSIAIDITGAQMEILWSAMVTAIGGKSWVGKEKVLEAFVVLAIDGKAYLEKDGNKVKELEKIVLREAKRNNVSYRGPALKSLGDFVEGFESLDLFEPVYNIVETAIKPRDEDDMEIDTTDGRSEKQIQHTTLVNGLKALSQSYRPSEDEKSIHEYKKILKMLAAHNVGGNLNLKACSIESLSLILDRLISSKVCPKSPEWVELFLQTWARILEHLRDRNYEAGRIKAAKIIGVFAKLVDFDTDLKAKVRKDLEKAIADEKSPMVLNVLRPAAAPVLGP